MGAREVLGLVSDSALLKRCTEVVRDDIPRLVEAKTRVDLYLDNTLPTTVAEIRRVFQTTTVQERAMRFAEFGAAQSLVRRIADELGRMLYTTPPTRTVIDPDAASGIPETSSADVAAGEAPTRRSPATKAYAEFLRGLRANAKLDLVARLVTPCNQVGLFVRQSKSLGLVLDVLTPDRFSVIPHPDDPTVALAIIIQYATQDREGRNVLGHWYWDDSVQFRFTTETPEPTLLSDVTPHSVGAIPLVVVRAREFWGGYWDTTRGANLVAAQRAISFLLALVMKLHKAQGENIPVITGTVGDLAKGQVMDAESPVVLPQASQVTMLGSVTDPGHYWKSIYNIWECVGRDYGIANLIQNAANTTASEEDTAILFERRNELVRIFGDAEQRLFSLFQRMAPDKVAAGSRLRIDFEDASYRGDRETQLRVAEVERRMGLVNTLDLIRAKNPEIEDEEEAWAEFLHNEAVEAHRIDFQAKRNATQGADSNRSPEDNGRLGPRARDDKDGVDGADTPAAAEVSA